MIIKTVDGWRQWQRGVVNIDGHAIPKLLFCVKRIY